MIKNPSWRYHFVARFLHWLIAIVLIGLICLGWYMRYIEDQPNSDWYFDLHKSLGIVAAMLILLRIIWRITHRPAALPVSVPAWQALLARLSHWLLYICMIIMPVTGFMGAEFSKYGVAFFGWALPNWVTPDHAISKQLFKIHWLTVWILTGLIVLHFLAAMKHLLINKDEVFKRIWFW